MQKRNLILELTNSACIQSYMDNVLSFKSVIHTGIVIIVERKKKSTELSSLQIWLQTSLRRRDSKYRGEKEDTCVTWMRC